MFRTLLTMILLLPCAVAHATGAMPTAPSAPSSPISNFRDPKNLSTIVMMGAFVLIFYFLLIRPQRQQTKQRQELLNALKVGDKIITSGGIYGEIVEMKDKSVRVKIAKDVILRMDRSGIQGKSTKADE